MSVLIKGMEMPKTGQIVLVEIDENGDVFAAYDGGRTKLTQHKAVPVPPHGRLIDADELDKMLKFIGEAEAQIYGRNHWGFVNKCRQAIEDAPTVIEAEEGE